MLAEIRSIAFPSKRIPLQQALAVADESGDGYLDKRQFTEAFHRAGINMPKDNLDHLFDVMSERFDEPSDDTKICEKFIDLKFFNLKLFTS